MHRLIHIVAPILVFVAGCGDAPSPQRSDSSAPTRSASDQQTKSTSPPQEQPAVSPIPKDVTYTIIDQNVLPGIKRSLDIRLNKKVSEGALRSIATQLRGSDSNSYERTFIGYYLPDMEVNAGYWATSHFNPDLEVRILGLTAEQEETLKLQPADPSRELIGTWIDERPHVGNRITIFLEDDKLFMENTYKDGSSGQTEVVEKKSPLGRRFEKVAGSNDHDHWILKSDGSLQLRDDEGLIATAKKIE